MSYKHIALLLIIFFWMASCSMFRSSHKQAAEVDKQADAVIYSDSVDNIILNAESVIWYEIKGMTERPDSLKEGKRILGYEIKQVHTGLADQGMDDVLLFIISDREWYVRDYAPVRQPFYPNIIMDFSKRGQGGALMLYSFGSGEVAITRLQKSAADSAVNLKYYKMRDPRLMVRWVANRLPGNKYYQELLKL